MGLKSIQKEIWQECRRITNVSNATKCYICDADLTKAKGKQLGHLIPKQFLPPQMKYDLRLLKPCCYHCNMNLGGNSYLFGKKMEWEYGRDYMDKILEDFIFFKFTVDKLKPKELESFYLNKLKEYKEI